MVDGDASNVDENVAFLGDTAQHIFDQELTRARALDTKAAGVVAACLALLAAGLGFATRFAELSGGPGAKTLWVVTFGIAAVLLLVAGGMAVSAIMPRDFAAFHTDEVRSWLTREIMEHEPSAIRGRILYGHYLAIDGARRVIKLKGDRLSLATRALALALLFVVFCGLSIAVHTAMYPASHVSRRLQPAHADEPKRLVVECVQHRRRDGFERAQRAHVRPTADGPPCARGRLLDGRR